MAVKNKYTIIPQEIETPNIIRGFCKLKIASPKEEIFEWLLENFPKSETRENIISYISRDEMKLEDKFYHKERKFIIFYFQVYNRKSKCAHTKHISLRRN